MSRELGRLQFYVWQYRMARFTRDRRSLAMRTRWQLRRLASGPDHDAALCWSSAWMRCQVRQVRNVSAQAQQVD